MNSLTNAEMVAATECARNNSPFPVPETAQVPSDANVPAPITGLSPILPGGFAVIPKVYKDLLDLYVEMTEEAISVCMAHHP